MTRAYDRELEALMQRFYKLRDADKLRAYKSIRDHLGGRTGRESSRDQTVRMRSEALEALAQVRDRLGLAGDQAPTKAAFDREARARGLDWTVLASFSGGRGGALRPTLSRVGRRH